MVSALLLWFTVIPALKFLLVDAVWQRHRSQRVPGGKCRPCGRRVLALCRRRNSPQFIYGFYPEPERWRVNLTFVLAALLLLPLLIPRLPAKGLNAGLFFLAFPVVAFFLLHGGGLSGFGVSWTAGLLVRICRQHRRCRPQARKRRRGDRGDRAAAAVARESWSCCSASPFRYLIWPLTWLRDQIQASGHPVWVDFAATAVIVSILLFLLSGGIRTGWRALIVSLAIFAGIGVVIAVMGLDRGGLPVVDTRLWGGLLVTLVVSVTGIVTSMPVGIALALGRRSTIPLIRIFSIAFIEFWRGVPLITVLFFATYMLPLFVPGRISPSTAWCGR